MSQACRSRTLDAAPERVWRTVGDPRHLARWWPKVQRVEGVDEDHFTELLQTDRGRGVRADWVITETLERQRLACEQVVAGTPFEGVLAAASREITLQPAGDDATIVTITIKRRMRGMSRLSGAMMRRATVRQVDAALDNLVLLHGEARVGR